MKKRKIRVIGTSFYVLLSPTDIKDYKLKKDSELDLEEALKKGDVKNE